MIFGIIEFIRGSILTGFPWNLIAYSFSNQTEFIQINSIVGIYGFNLLSITLFTVPAVLITRKSKKNIYFVIAINFSITSATTLSGVEAPDVIPTLISPSGIKFFFRINSDSRGL